MVESIAIYSVTRQYNSLVVLFSGSPVEDFEHCYIGVTAIKITQDSVQSKAILFNFAMNTNNDMCNK